MEIPNTLDNCVNVEFNGGDGELFYDKLPMRRVRAMFKWCESHGSEPKIYEDGCIIFNNVKSGTPFGTMNVYFHSADPEPEIPDSVSKGVSITGEDFCCVLYPKTMEDMSVIKQWCRGGEISKDDRNIVIENVMNTEPISINGSTLTLDDGDVVRVVLHY